MSSAAGVSPPAEGNCFATPSTSESKVGVGDGALVGVVLSTSDNTVGVAVDMTVGVSVEVGLGDGSIVGVLGSVGS